MLKKYLKEIIVLVLQILAFYLLPLFAGPGDEIGMVFLLIISAFALALVLGTISKNKLKFLYPLAVAVAFIPSVFIYYNESALVHALWYLVVSAVGIAIGSLIEWIVRTKGKHE